MLFRPSDKKTKKKTKQGQMERNKALKRDINKTKQKKTVVSLVDKVVQVWIMMRTHLC